MSKKTELQHGVQYHLVQIVATPGLVLWLFSWLFIMLFVFYAVAVQTNSVQPYVVPGPPEPSTAPVSFDQLVIAGLLSLFLWYAMGFALHYFLSKLANRFENPNSSYRIATVGGTVLAGLILILGSFVISGTVQLTFGALIGGFCLIVGSISFGLQQLLAKLWSVELV